MYVHTATTTRNRSSLFFTFLGTECTIEFIRMSRSDQSFALYKALIKATRKFVYTKQGPGVSV